MRQRGAFPCIGEPTETVETQSVSGQLGSPCETIILADESVIPPSTRCHIRRNYEATMVNNLGGEWKCGMKGTVRYRICVSMGEIEMCFTPPAWYTSPIAIDHVTSM